MNHKITTEPVQEPIDLDDAKVHLRITTDDDDDYIRGLIAVARRWSEQFQHRSFVTQTITMKLNVFPLIIQCPAPPLQTVTSITYVDTAGDTQTLDSSKYVVDTFNTPGRIYEAHNTTWPATRNELNSVTVVYVAGYGIATDVPDAVKHAIKIMLSHWYENRTPVSCAGDPKMIPMTAQSLLYQDRTSLI